jgi:hypothetical protein
LKFVPTSIDGVLIVAFPLNDYPPSFPYEIIILQDDNNLTKTVVSRMCKTIISHTKLINRMCKIINLISIYLYLYITTGENYNHLIVTGFTDVPCILVSISMFIFGFITTAIFTYLC